MMAVCVLCLRPRTYFVLLTDGIDDIESSESPSVENDDGLNGPNPGLLECLITLVLACKPLRATYTIVWYGVS